MIVAAVFAVASIGAAAILGTVLGMPWSRVRSAVADGFDSESRRRRALRRWPGALRLAAGILESGGTLDEAMAVLAANGLNPTDRKEPAMREAWMAVPSAALSLAKESGAGAARLLDDLRRVVDRRLGWLL
jgi:hypothetical protein